eukprot:12229578-Heterocapsa_arctica.AAC.1
MATTGIYKPKFNPLASRLGRGSNKLLVFSTTAERPPRILGYRKPNDPADGVSTEVLERITREH